MKKHVLQLTFGIIMFLFAVAVQAADIALVITAEDVSSIIDDDEKAAADWLVANVPNGHIITTNEILNATVNLEEYELLWISIDRVGTGEIPTEFSDPTVLEAISTFYKTGGNILLTNHATQYIVNLGRTTRTPNILGAGEGGSNNDSWGINANIGLINDHTTHPLYADLSVDNTSFSHPFFPLIGSGHKEDHNSMWDLNSYGYEGDVLDAFEVENDAVVIGTWQHVTDFCCAGIVEFQPVDEFSGTAIAIGVAAYEWNQNSGVNVFQSNIELMTLNAINYLTSVSASNADQTLFSNNITRLHPNPMEDKLFFEITLDKSQKIDIELINLEGGVVFKSTSSGVQGLNVIKCNVENLAKGLYIYQITTQSEGVISGKILK